jgi:hypothetical protein
MLEPSIHRFAAFEYNDRTEWRSSMSSSSLALLLILAAPPSEVEDEIRRLETACHRGSKEVR